MMTAEELINVFRNNEIELPEGASLMLAYVDKDGNTELAGNIRPEWLKFLGMHYIEMAIKNEIKAAL